MLEWRKNIAPAEWDELLTFMKGHFLQSAVWGEARKQVDSINDARYVALSNGKPIYMARVETRIFLKKIKIAWMPRGPVCNEKDDFLRDIHKEFLKRLKDEGYFFCCSAPWKRLTDERKSRSNYYTIWIDLQLGIEKIWENLKKQVRYDVRRSKKLGVVIKESKDQKDLEKFHQAGMTLSLNKGFNFNVSINLLMFLSKQNNPNVEFCLFVAEYQGSFCGGAIIIRCGKNMHYMWGVTDREFKQLTIGEAIQWAIIEWGCERNCTKYDLEGISSKGDSGVDRFKQKLGGEVIINPGVKIYPLQWLSGMAVYSLKWYISSLYKFTKYLNRRPNIFSARK